MRQVGQAGFTLLELVVVMVLLAIVAAVMMTQIPGMINKRKASGLAQATVHLAQAIETLRADEDCGPTYLFLTQGCEGEAAPADAMDFLTQHGVTISRKFFRGMDWEIQVPADGSYADIRATNLPNADLCTMVAERINKIAGTTDIDNATDVGALDTSHGAIRAVCDTTGPTVITRLAGYRIW